MAMQDGEGMDPWSDRAHQEVAQELGTARMEAIRFRRMANDLYRENEGLRQLVTQERMANQALQAELEETRTAREAFHSRMEELAAKLEALRPSRSKAKS